MEDPGQGGERCEAGQGGGLGRGDPDHQVWSGGEKLNDERAEDPSGWTEDGERLPAASQGHELQWEDQGTHREVYTGNGVTQNQKPGTVHLLLENDCPVRLRSQNSTSRW